MIEHFGATFCSMEPGHPLFREPLNGEWLIGLYRENDGSMCPILLWVDPKIDLLWDPSLRQHVKPPSSYLLLQHQPQIDGNTSHPLVVEYPAPHGTFQTLRPPIFHEPHLVMQTDGIPKSR